MPNNKNKENLFNDFPPISTEKWMEKVKADYKTDDPQSKILWKTGEGINIKGIYRYEDIGELNYLNSQAGEFPFVRGIKTHNNWKINTQIEAASVVEANSLALLAIKRGANSIEFDFSNINSVQDIDMLLNNINIEEIQLVISNTDCKKQSIDLLIDYINSNKINSAKTDIILSTDALSKLIVNGDYSSLRFEENIANLFMISMHSKTAGINAKIISIDAQIFHNAGATTVQEIAYALSSAIEHIDKLQSQGVNINDILKSLSFTIAIGSSYFIEIAKIRALRYLWAKIIEAYNSDSKQNAKAHIHAVSSKWNKSLYDPYVNMLRTTTETMSAAISGADVISVDNFDKYYHNENVFANRISQNQQILIKEEAHFDKVVDPAGGSYYIENMTSNLIEGIWKLFLEIETEGGFAKYIETGKLNKEIEKSAEQKLLFVATRRLNILGTNQFPNQEEEMLSEIEKPVSEKNNGLQMHRAAEQFDKIRLQTEQYEKKNGKRPVVQLISFGNLAMRKARAGFISNFFACGGYDIQEEENCLSAEQANKLINNAELAILCSSDDEYLDFVKQLSEIKSQNTDVLIAGNPKAISEELKELGISDFIHVRTNVLESLAKYNQKFYNAKY